MAIPPFGPPPLPSQAGNSGKFLTTNGSSSSWGTLTAGQTLVTKVVAASGGDYTTLGAALAAASSGWTIYVTPGTYTESAITVTSLNNIAIIGESPEATIISMGTNNFTLSSSSYMHIEGLRFSFSTGAFNFPSGSTNVEFINNHVISSGTNGHTFASNYGLWSGNYMTSASTDTATPPYNWTGNWPRIIGNTIIANATITGTGNGNILFGCTNGLITGNTINYNASGSTNLIKLGGQYNTFSGNIVQNTTTAVTPVALFAASNSNTITGNAFQWIGGFIIRENTGNLTINSNVFRVSSTTNCIMVSLEGGASTVSGNLFIGNSNTTVAVQTSSASNNVTGNYALLIAKFVQQTSSDNNNYTGNSAAGIAIATTTVIAFDIQAGNYANITGNRATGFSSAVKIGSGVNATGITGNNFQGNSATQANVLSDVGIGTHWMNNTGITHTKTITHMKNTSAAQRNSYEVVVWKAVAGGDEFTTSTTQGDATVIGIVDQSAIANNSYGPICTEGPTQITVQAAGTNIAIGDWLSHSTVAANAQKAVAGDYVFAIALAAATTNAAIINCRVVKPFKL